MSTNKEQLLEAREKLKANNLEAGLPGREDHFNQLRTFLIERLKVKKKTVMGSHLNQTIFICGVPGTGKTATVKAAIESLKKVTPKLSYKLIEINGMQLTAPDKVYSEMLYQMTDEKMNPEKAQDKLTSMFTSDRPEKAPKKHTILVIDELDTLYSERRQTIFYNLFDWPTSANSKLIVIAIANAMDLPERFMSGKVMSRLGWEKLIFESYTSDGLEKIVAARLGKKNVKCFDNKAIVLATKKVGRTSGDARRILDLCRMGIDLAIDNNLPKVTPALIDQAANQNFDLHRRNALFRCSNLQKLILRCILKEAERLGEENVKVMGVHTQLMHMLDNYKFIKKPNIDKFYKDVVDMAAQSLIFIDIDKPFLEKRIFIRSMLDSIQDIISQFVIEQPKPLKQLMPKN